jgi:hypothetical protein
MVEKQWKTYGNYRVSDYGDIYSPTKDLYLKHQISEDGYSKIRLTFSTNHRISWSIHRLVYFLFGEDFNPELEINHKDGDKLNNHISNLEMCDRSYNIQHAWDTGLLQSTAERSKKISEGLKGQGLGKDNNNSFPIQCINTEEVFECVQHAADWCETYQGNFSKYFRGLQQSVGKHPQTGEKLLWKKLN